MKAVLCCLPLFLFPQAALVIAWGVVPGWRKVNIESATRKRTGYWTWR